MPGDVLWGDVLLLVTFCGVMFCGVMLCGVTFCGVTFCRGTFYKANFQGQHAAKGAKAPMDSGSAVSTNRAVFGHFLDGLPCLSASQRNDLEAQFIFEKLKDAV